MPDSGSRSAPRIARTFQNIRLFAGMTVLENLIVAQHNPLMRASGCRLPGSSACRATARPSAQAIERARYWLDRIGLTDRADDPAGALPYGEQRRLEIARAMCTGPVLLCLDEPAAGLNPRECAELNELLLRHPRRAATVDPADRARHARGDGDFRPRRRARLRAQDRRRHAGRGAQRPEVIAAYLGVEDEEVRRSRRRSRVGVGSCDDAPLLSLPGVTAYYGNIVALKGVDHRGRRGEIVTMIGANGAGKSTLMMTIFGHPRASAGRDRVRRARHHPAADARIVRLGDRAVAGRAAHLPAHDGLENLQMGADFADNAAISTSDLARVFAIFPLLKERLDQRGGTLSGGEQQMLASRVR